MSGDKKLALEKRMPWVRDGGQHRSNTADAECKALIARIRRGDFTVDEMRSIATNPELCIRTAVAAEAALQLKLLAKIESGQLSEQELITQHENASLKGGGHLVAAIERKMRGQFPTAANRLFGKRADFAAQCLQGVLRELGEVVDLVGNRVKNGVKTGGEKLAGRMRVSQYISYRGIAGGGAYLSLEQNGTDSELRAVVVKYAIGKRRFRKTHTYTMERFGEASTSFIRMVQEAARNAAST